MARHFKQYRVCFRLFMKPDDPIQELNFNAYSHQDARVRFNAWALRNSTQATYIRYVIVGVAEVKGGELE